MRPEAVATACPAGHNYGIMNTESDRLPGAAFYDNPDEEHSYHNDVLG